MTDPTPEQVEAFKAEWANANSEGDLGNRVKRGLTAAAGVTPQESGERERLAEGFRNYLGDGVYVCSRDASAWLHGTMTLEDFEVLASEDEGTIDALVDIALAAPVQVDEAKLAEVLAAHEPHLDQTACYSGGCACGAEIPEDQFHAHVARTVAEWLRGGGR